jgi:hypothetical protein
MATSGAQQVPQRSELASLAAFGSAIAERRVAGSPVRTGAAFFLITLSLTDLLASMFGAGGFFALLLEWCAQALPASLHTPTTAAVLYVVMHGAAIGIGGLQLHRSPWRRWLGPSLRANVPFRTGVRALQRAVRPASAPPAPGAYEQRTLAVQAVLFVAILIAMRPAYALLLQWPAMNAPLAGAALILFAYLSTWLLGTLYENAVNRRGAVTTGDRATAIGMIAALLVSVPAAVGVDPSPVLLGRFGMSAHAADVFRAWEFYAALSLLIMTTALCLGSVTDSEFEIFDVDPQSTIVRMELPLCTGGEYASFKFRVRPNGNQVLLLAADPAGALHYTLLSTDDAHDLTAARYVLVNFSALARRQSSRVAVSYDVLRGRFRCSLELGVAVSSVEAFIADLRREGGRFPMQVFAVFADKILVDGMQQPVFQVLFESAINAVQREVMGGAPNNFSEIRTFQETLVDAAANAIAGFNQQATIFQDANRSAIEHARPDLSASAVSRRMEELLAGFMNQYKTLMTSLRGENELTARVLTHARATAAQAMEMLMRTVITDPATLQEGQRFLRLIGVSVLNVSVQRTPSSIEVENRLEALRAEVQAVHHQAMEKIRAASQAFGAMQTDLVKTLATSPTTPHGGRVELLDRVLRSVDSRNAAPALPGSQGVARLPPAERAPGIANTPRAAPVRGSLSSDPSADPQQVRRNAPDDEPF